jgi:DNA-binding NtrC family response regulator
MPNFAWISESCSSTAYEGLIGQYGIARIGIHDASRILNDAYDLVIASFPLPELTPEELVETYLMQKPASRIVVLLPGMSAEQAVRLTRLGAYQCFGEENVVNPMIDCIEAVTEEIRTLNSVSAHHSKREPWKKFLVGQSGPMREVEEIVRLVAEKRCTVLITGETGTGKELAARALHLASPRGSLPMVAVNCGALPETLLEAELFGHAKGAFTGAVNHRVGRFEQANNSTLFLDEIGELPMELQAKLLRVLQEREVQRLGSSETVKLDIRIIAATNVNLAERVKAGRFREDLYYRLNVVPLRLPPLRRRTEDIPLLVNYFIEKICRAEGIALKKLNPSVMDRLMLNDWPGNIRELENAVEMAIALSGDRQGLGLHDFRLAGSPKNNLIQMHSAPQVPAESHEIAEFGSAVEAFARNLLLRAMQKTGGNKTLAANLLGMKRTTLISKLHNLENNSLSALA